MTASANSGSDSSSISASVRIEPLQGSENIAPWKVKIMDILTSLGLEDTITSDPPQAPEDADKATLIQHEKAKAEFKRRSLQALSHIRLRVSDAVLVYISAATTAKEAWDTLMQTFQPSGMYSYILAYRKFYQTRCPDGGDIPEHLGQMRRLRDEIHTIAGTARISDREFAFALLISLPDSWDQFIQAIDATADNLTSAQVIARILQEDKRRKEREGAKGDSALLAKSKKKARPRCHNCGKQGHLKKDCWASGGGAADKPKANDAVDGEFGFIAAEGQNSADPEPDIEKALSALDESRLWYADSGATTHVANARELFHKYQPTAGGASISGLGGVSRIAGRGSVKLKCKVGNRIRKIWLHNVVHVPGAPHNLLSLTRADDAHCRYVGGKGTLTMYGPDGKILMVGRKLEGPGQLYRLSVAAELADQANVAVLGKRTWEEMHRILGHAHLASIKRLCLGLAEGVDVDMTSDDQFQCESCVRAKQHVQPFPDQATRTPDKLKVGEIVASDTWGPAQVRSVHSFYYYMSMTDLKSRFSGVYFSAQKSGLAKMALTEFRGLIRRMSRTGSSIMCLRIDNGTEFINNEFLQYCKSQGIVVETTAPYSPAQNGVAERLNRTLRESARAMLLAAELPRKFWPEAVSYACLIKNRLPHAALKGMTPYQALTGEKPDLSLLREFRSKCWVLDQSGNPGKLDAKSRPCIFLGFATDSKAFRCWDIGKNTFVKSRNVVFAARKREQEVLLPSPRSAPEGESADTSSRAPEGQGAAAQAPADPSDPSAQKSSAAEGSGGVPDGKPAQPKAPTGVRPPTREASARLRSKPPVDYLRMHNPQARGPRQSKSTEEDAPADAAAEPDASSDSDDVVEYAYLGADLADDDPRSYRDALKRPDAARWQEAMQREYDQLTKLGCWDLVDLPAGRKAIGCKWVYRIKRNFSGAIIKYKARLVAQGFSQVPGVDYDETYAPVMRPESLHILAAIAVILNLEWDIENAVGAYLNSQLKLTIYMRQPEGFDDGSGRVCKLNLALYGLKQSGREWNLLLDEFLRGIGFRASSVDPCVYLRIDEGSPTFLAVHVDDFSLFAKTREIMDKLKGELSSRFEMTDLGPVRQILGYEVIRERDQRTLMLRQAAYIRKVLDRFNMADSNPVSVPMDPNTRLQKTPDAPPPDFPYREAVGSLMYAAVGTRPDISYAVQTLSQFCERPSTAHWTALKRVLRYLKGTAEWGIIYKAPEAQTTPIEVVGYSDADWGANPDDQKSISGYVFLLGGAPVCWASRKQKSVALSSMEAEYMAGSTAASQALWCRMLLEELGFAQPNPTLLYMDNQSALALARNTGTQGRAKHIDIRYHFLRDKISSKEISVAHCPGEDNPADIFTKPLARQKFEHFRAMLGMSASRGSVEERA
uniref:Polyprotein n=1 Tax=Phanerochaete chrysosporium (strain RP-78 / ATCC MYA-4764 / FGSC 9002) TaxID=273507 RepID=Q45W66_PHACR|nr:polyprotein [Phanerochaete chrysosporium RP-78]